MTTFLQAVVGLSFTVSFLSKVRRRSSWEAFVRSVRQVVGPRVSPRPIAGFVAASEAVVVALIVIPGMSALGFAYASLLLLAFCLAIVHVVRTGRTAVCRCFGLSDRPLSYIHVARNATLLTAAVAGLLLPRTPAPALSPAEWIVGGLLAVATTALVVAFDELVGVFVSDKRQSISSVYIGGNRR